MSDYYSEQSKAASSGRAGADRMAAGLGICVDEERGDLDEVLRLRAEIARLREERRWIPVGERLPEVGSLVLAFINGEVMEATLYASSARLLAWQTDRKGYRFNATHWQPLPPPPEAAG